MDTFLKVNYKGILVYEILMDWKEKNAENYIQLS